MIRKHENSVSMKAGMLAAGVHVVLLTLLLVSFNWKAAHPVMDVTEVELWDKLPGKSVPKPPEIKVEPKPEPKSEVVKEEPKPTPAPKIEDKLKLEEPKVDIELEKKKEALKKKELAEKEQQLEEKKLQDKKLEEKRKKDEALEKIKHASREEDLQEKADTKKAAKERSDAIKKLQQDALNDEKGESAKQASAANANEIGAYKAKIQAKIRGNVNKTLCGDGNPELRFEINLLPTGELSGTPKITKSSGSSACDDAVERAITSSQPLPLPSDPGLFSSFRNLNLKFRPNDN